MARRWCGMNVWAGSLCRGDLTKGSLERMAHLMEN